MDKGNPMTHQTKKQKDPRMTADIHGEERAQLGAKKHQKRRMKSKGSDGGKSQSMDENPGKIIEKIHGPPIGNHTMNRGGGLRD